jgi:cell division septation protein DedD
LPQLLATADAAPNSVSQLLPAYRNVEALYDVLLRVCQVANLAAPSQQSAAIDHARASLEDARHTLGDRINSAALAQEQQVHSLQAALRAVPPPAAPVVCPTPAPVKKHRTARKTVKKTAPAPAATQSTPPASH